MGMFVCETCGENRSDKELTFYARHGWPNDAPEDIPCWGCDPDQQTQINALLDTLEQDIDTLIIEIRGRAMTQANESAREITRALRLLVALYARKEA